MARVGRLPGVEHVALDDLPADERRRADAAAEVYREWHQKDVDAVMRATYDFPDSLRVAGYASSILYLADKWEVDGDAYDYIHEFDSRPTVYTVDGDGPAVPTARLLGVRSLAHTLVLPVLAVTKELVTVDAPRKNPAGRQRMAFRPKWPLLCSTVDKLAVVCFTDTGPVVIRGGTMRVTERGIVH